MCGIAGIFKFNKTPISKTQFEVALDQLTQRGPDHGSIQEFETAILGHRRLSIIDTSVSANQPMFDATGRYCIVFNGEIFNFRELKKNHLSSHTFQTHSDTEVLLTLFTKLGIECVKLLDGFFAFAIYDRQENKITLARDRFGKKPLHYFVNEDGFFFASEMKALLKMGLDKTINMEALQLYFQLNYIPQPHSIFKHASKLAPATYIEIDSDGNTNSTLYYSPQVNVNPSISYEDACKTLDEKMSDAVEKRLISDVPIGAFLSGGIDSSVVVALARKHVKDLNTFSIGYKNNPIYDETKYANLVAKKYNTNHTVFKLDNNDFLENVMHVLDYIDEPFADSSALPVYILSKLTREHVTVALSGDGGDEVFSGYNKHRAEWRMRQTSVLNSLLQIGYPITKLLPQGRNNSITNLIRQVNRFAEGASLNAKDRYWKWATFYSAQDLKDLFTNTTHAHIQTDKIEEIKKQYIDNITPKEFNEILISDLKLVLAGDMLVKVDLMSMANSLEVRSPFLDHHVVDFAFTLPTEYKINKDLNKRIVQDAFRSYLPEELYNRPKHGFEIPLKEWFKNELWPLIDQDLLKNSFIEEQQIFNPEYIINLKKQLFQSKIDVTWRIWSLIVFQYWYKKYIA